MIGETLLTGVITNLLTDAVYLGYRKTKQLKRDSLKYKDEIQKRIALFFSEYEGSLFDSSTFAEYLELPQVSDAIKNYICYIAAGKYVKGKETFTKEADVVRYLTENALAMYNGQLTVPSRRKIEIFFTGFFDTARQFYFSCLNIRDRSLIFFINQKIDSMEERLQKSIAQNVKKKNPDYADILSRYDAIVKKKNQSLFVYGYRELKLEDFYVVPRLMKSIGGEAASPIEAGQSSLMNKNNICTYTDIFRTDNIVYVIGGAGYGKSVLLKNIIVNYKKMHLNNEKEHLVIYCDLKNFYKNPQGSVPSVNDFLIESIVEESGMSRNEITENFLNYYLSIGRVIILLDALDEVPRQYRESLHKKITSYFLTCNPNNKVCITSRDRGFYPQNEIEVFQILPLNTEEINKYLNNMIRLHYFNESDKEAFLRQAAALIQQDFLTSFLILSLLVNIFQAEKELPQTKTDLYSKCFYYISRDREREKAELDKKYNWTDIMKLMKDNTFIELSKLACPNNKNISEETILNHLSRHYKRKFGGIDKAETAVMEFLKFCSERTELFVPAQQDGTYRFFHRSFFEFFYSKHISKLKSPELIVHEFEKFDMDSEVFELTAAILKNEDELLYQQLIEYMIRQAGKGLKAETPKADMLNRLILVMQVVDDEEYIQEFCELLLDHSDILGQDQLSISYTISPFIHNILVASQLLHRYAESDAGLIPRFFEKYCASAFYDAIVMLSIVGPEPKKILEDSGSGKLLEPILHRLFPSIAFLSPDWISYFTESVRNHVNLRPLAIPDDSPETDYRNYRQKLYNDFLHQLSQLSDDQLKEFAHRIFGS